MSTVSPNEPTRRRRRRRSASRCARTHTVGGQEGEDTLKKEEEPHHTTRRDHGNRPDSSQIHPFNFLECFTFLGESGGGYFLVCDSWYSSIHPSIQTWFRFLSFHRHSSTRFERSTRTDMSDERTYIMIKYVRRRRRRPSRRRFVFGSRLSLNTARRRQLDDSDDDLID